MAGISQVTIDGVALDIDPSDYVMLGGSRRGSIHRTIDGGTVFQDRGINVTDLVIQISGMFTSVTTLKAIYAIYRKIGHQATLVDFKGNTFTVVFTPGAESFRAQPIYGSNAGYTYTMTLNVVAVVNWFGTVGGFPSST
jgi:hypothetical protein